MSLQLVAGALLLLAALMMFLKAEGSGPGFNRKRKGAALLLLAGILLTAAWMAGPVRQIFEETSARN